MRNRRPNDATKRPILMTSLPRSGSTWTAKVMGEAPGVRLNFEPDRLHLWGLAHKGQHRYIPPDAEDPNYENVYRSAFAGFAHPAKPLTTAHLRRLFYQATTPFRFNQRVLVKSVHSLLNVEWIYVKFQPQVVILLRNPLNLIYSIYRKWPEARLGDLLSQETLMRTHLSDFEDTLTNAKTPFGILATRVGAYYRIVSRLSAQYPEWLVITHESLCTSSREAFQNLFGHLHLAWTPAVQSYLESTNREKSSDAVQHVHRISEMEVEKWRTLLSDEQIREIRDYYTAFESGYYEELMRVL